MTRRKHVMYVGLMILVTLALAPAGQVSRAQESTYAAYQPFEGGMMLWFEDSGVVWTLSNLGMSLGTFQEIGYGSMPDNPVSDQPPSGLIKPVNAFGRVWGNFPAIRAQLGWATGPEQGYTATLGPTSYTAGGLRQMAVNLPDGTMLVIRQDNTWGYYGQPRRINSLPGGSLFPASRQTFQGGMMLWWSETGSIWVLTNEGSAHVYHSQAYGALPDNPVTTQPPDGMRRPILGFGQVWGNFPAVRQTLGWATGPEEGYLLRFERHVNLSGVGGSAIHFRVNLPDGRDVLLRDNATWAYAP